MNDEKEALLAVLKETTLILDGRDEKTAPLIEAGRELWKEGAIEMAEDPIRELFAMRLK